MIDPDRLLAVTPYTASSRVVRAARALVRHRDSLICAILDVERCLRAARSVRAHVVLYDILIVLANDCADRITVEPLIAR